MDISPNVDRLLHTPEVSISPNVDRLLHTPEVSISPNVDRLLHTPEVSISRTLILGGGSQASRLANTVGSIYPEVMDPTIGG